MAEDEMIEAGKTLATWDPHTHPIITEMEGYITFTDVIEGVTVTRNFDEITGLTSIVVTDPKQRPTHAKDLRPMVHLVDDNGRDLTIVGTEIPRQITTCHQPF
ncbi:MAG: hypothetical protein R3E08_09190 [Thiotrichaceae bacterium]